MDWFGVIAVVIMVAIFGFIGLSMWAAQHHNKLVDQLTGDGGWSSKDGVASLSIAEQTRTVQIGRDESRTDKTGAMLISGQIDGRPASGRVVLENFSPWISTAHTTLLGEGWTLDFSHLPGQLIATSDSGRVITFFRP